MTKVIALAGKGGTGKTTIAALLTRTVLQQGVAPVLAIDADPATNLHLALGLPAPATVGDVREGMLAEAQKGALGVAVARRDHLQHELRMAHRGRSSGGPGSDGPARRPGLLLRRQSSVA